jgi:hypothetical protein
MSNQLVEQHRSWWARCHRTVGGARSGGST